MTHHTRWIGPAAALLLLGAAACSSNPFWKHPAETVVLWDGGDLDGWKMAGPGEFVVEDGALRATGGMGLLWYAERDFEDFLLELEWRAEEPDDNSGVFVRFPDPGDDPWVAVNHGYEIQICDAAQPEHDTGSIYSFADSEGVPTKEPGEWNQMRILVVGNEYQVTINGEEVVTFSGDRGLRGHVGLQNHDDGSPVRFRNIRVTLL